MRPLQDAMPGALAQVLLKAPLTPGKINFAWRAAVGPALERASAARLEGRVLVVETRGPQWTRELTRSAEVILARLEKLLGDGVVTRIDVRSGPHA